MSLPPWKRRLTFAYSGEGSTTSFSSAIQAFSLTCKAARPLQTLSVSSAEWNRIASTPARGCGGRHARVLNLTLAGLRRFRRLSSLRERLPAILRNGFLGRPHCRVQIWCFKVSLSWSTEEHGEGPLADSQSYIPGPGRTIERRAAAAPTAAPPPSCRTLTLSSGLAPIPSV